jgi:hypothetical protein
MSSVEEMVLLVLLMGFKKMLAADRTSAMSLPISAILPTLMTRLSSTQGTALDKKRSEVYIDQSRGNFA